MHRFSYPTMFTTNVLLYGYSCIFVLMFSPVKLSLLETFLSKDTEPGQHRYHHIVTCAVDVNLFLANSFLVASHIIHP
ncbi:hypothetical protein REPUB_Repub12eG0098400 [Reevesia pubescens]